MHQLSVGNVLWQMYHTMVTKLRNNSPGEGHGDISITTLHSFINRLVKVGVRRLRTLCAQVHVYMTASATSLVLNHCPATLAIIFD